MTDVIVCMRVADLPMPYTRSQALPCAWCGLAIWVGYAVRKDVPHGLAVCHQCVATKLSEVDEVTIARPGPAFRRAFQRWLDQDRFHD